MGGLLKPATHSVVSAAALPTHCMAVWQCAWLWQEHWETGSHQIRCTTISPHISPDGNAATGLGPRALLR